MYEAFYGLRERPFNLTPDPRFLYLSEKHKEAFAHLLYGIKNRSGFVMVTGEIGTGKTTICRNLLNQLDDDTEVAFIFNPSLNVVELLERIHSEFGIESRAQNALGLVDELNAYLLQKAAEGKNCVLVIDEAQNLSPQVLEQIRLLSNLETERDKLLQIILIGQPELGEMLQLHELRQLNQRITARYHLKPLSQRETLQYIAYRLHVAGAKRRVKFDKAAIRSVYRYSGGTPRVINALCDRAMLIGYTRENYEITRGLIRQAAREIRGERHKARKPGTSAFFGFGRLVPSSTVVVAVIMTLALAVFFAQPLERFTREFSAFNSIVGNGRTIDNAATEAGAISTPAAPAGTVAEAASTAPVSAGPVSAALMKLAEQSRKRPEDDPQPDVAAAPLDPAMARAAAVAAMMKAWQRESEGQLPADDTVPALRDFLKDRGLAHETVQASLDALFAINLPFFARIEDEGKGWWTAVIGRDGDTLHVSDYGAGRNSMTVTDFTRLYAGQAIIPWLDAAPQARVLKPDMANEDVAVFRQQLHRLGRVDDPAGRRYDNAVQAAVREIQQETGLEVDGVAGRQVRMVLASWLAEDFPHLQARPIPEPPADPIPTARRSEPKTPATTTTAEATAPRIADVASEAVPAPPAVPQAPAPEPLADVPQIETVPAEEAAQQSAPSDTAAEPLAPSIETAADPEPAAPARPLFWLGSNPGDSEAGQFGSAPASPGSESVLPAGAALSSMPPAAQPFEDRKRSTAPALSGVPIVPREPDDTPQQP